MTSTRHAFVQSSLGKLPLAALALAGCSNVDTASRPECEPTSRYGLVCENQTLIGATNPEDAPDPADGPVANPQPLDD